MSELETPDILRYNKDVVNHGHRPDAKFEEQLVKPPPLVSMDFLISEGQTSL